MSPKNFLKAAISMLGGQPALGEKIGVPQQTLSYWLRAKSGIVPAEAALAIERATSGRISRADLRPDIFGADMNNKSSFPRSSLPWVSKFEHAIALMGGQCAAGRTIGATQQRIFFILKKAKKFPTDLALPVELGTQGAVTRADLCPEVFSSDPHKTNSRTPRPARHPKSHVPISDETAAGRALS